MRPHTMMEQYEALQAQTVQDFEVMLWVNVKNPEMLAKFPKERFEKPQAVVANDDYGSR